MTHETGIEAKRSKQEIRALSLGPLQSPLAGVTRQRTDIRNWSRTTRKGQVFSFVLGDASGEIRTSVFGDDLREAWNLCAGGVVSITGTVVNANPLYNTVDNPFELTISLGKGGSLSASSENVHCLEPAYCFTEIAALKDVGLNKVVDVFGVIIEKEMDENVKTKAGANVLRGRIKLVDSSCRHVVCTFWGTAAIQVADWQIGGVLAIKCAKTTNYYGLSLNASSARSQLNPTIQEAGTLSSWYDAHAVEAGSYPSVLTEVGGGTQGVPFTLSMPQNVTLSQASQWSEVRLIVEGAVLVFLPTGTRTASQSSLCSQHSTATSSQSLNGPWKNSDESGYFD